MAAAIKPDKEAIRDWLRGRRHSKAPPPSMEQIKADLFNSGAKAAAEGAASDPARRLAAREGEGPGG